MTPKELTINKFLYSALNLGCWHEHVFKASPPQFETMAEHGYVACKHCDSLSDNQSLFTPDGFFILWEAMQKHRSWLQFEADNGLNVFHVVKTKIINPQTFPILVAEFLGWKEEV